MKEEDKLLLLCTIFENDENIELLEKIDFNRIDEKRMLQSLNGDNYKIRSLFIYNTKKYNIIECLPKEVQRFIDEEEVDVKEHYKKMLNQVSYVTKELDEAGYAYVLLKGLGVAETVYKKCPFVRDARDIDILVDSKDADEIFNIFLNRFGYSCDILATEQFLYKEYFQHYAPVCKDGIYIELHHRLTQKKDPYQINEARIISEAEELKVGNISVKIPNSLDMLISLSYHLFQHEFRETRYMLKPYADIYNFLYHYGKQFDWCSFIFRVKEDKLELPISYSLYYTDDIYMKLLGKHIVPEWVLSQLISKDYSIKRDSIVSRHLFNEDTPIGRWPYSHTERMFMETKILRQELCKQFFFFYCDESWRKVCKGHGIDFSDDYIFSPREWEKCGRI